MNWFVVFAFFGVPIALLCIGLAVMVLDRRLSRNIHVKWSDNQEAQEHKINHTETIRDFEIEIARAVADKGRILHEQGRLQEALQSMEETITRFESLIREPSSGRLSAAEPVRNA